MILYFLPVGSKAAEFVSGSRNRCVSGLSLVTDSWTDTALFNDHVDFVLVL